LGIDLDAVVGRRGRAHDPAVIVECLAVPVAELVQQPRRALDVREERVTTPLGSARGTRPSFRRTPHLSRGGSRAVRLPALALEFDEQRPCRLESRDDSLALEEFGGLLYDGYRLRRATSQP
jgi:hypothetical protein